jgi:hypothetical protein
MENPIRDDVARLRAFGAVLPPEIYEDLSRDAPSMVEELPPEVGAMLAAMLLKSRRDAMSARIAALPKEKQGTLGAPLQRKIDVIDAALAGLGSAKAHGKSGSQTTSG